MIFVVNSLVAQKKAFVLHEYLICRYLYFFTLWNVKIKCYHRLLRVAYQFQNVMWHFSLNTFDRSRSGNWKGLFRWNDRLSNNSNTAMERDHQMCQHIWWFGVTLKCRKATVTVLCHMTIKHESSHLLYGKKSNRTARAIGLLFLSTCL